ncbi:AraC family transcriptional regulator [Gallaecimonas xiamenensis]|uniref:AraC family transcriptional regulator n=1 Tax=Gallaecimonas xiamenensis 3-C-1 TaxID=745411 RepID=K2JF69_9GAMM|nr:AraC family transcriptional regulator [Gallaecimonas xiamenensis]EKE73738.1 AraC family transcriptional regulator [Gallaecimonas xiamenensis 3-C-1]
MDSAQSKTSDALASLRSRLLRLANHSGDYQTEIAALSIHRRDKVSEPLPCVYELGLAITVAGYKQTSIGDLVFDNSPGQSLLASVDIPVVAKVTQASPADPYLAIMLRLDPRLVMQVASQVTLPRAPKELSYSALSQGRLDSGMLEAVDRLVALLDTPELLPLVAPLTLQEIIARLLLSPHGATYMHLNASGSSSRHITQVMGWLKNHFNEAISIETLADMAHMSTSSFRHHFKAVSGMSPLQYLKQLRLQEARQLMLNDELDVSSAGFRVGYESASQFSREYARLFGAPPLRDIKELREQVN